VHEINGQRIRLKPNDCSLIEARDAHGFQPLRDGYSHVNIAFPAATCGFLMERYFSEEGRAWHRDGHLPRVIALTVSQRQYFDALARELSEADRADRTSLRIDRFLLNVFLELAPHRPGDAFKACPKWLRSACEALRGPEHFREGTTTLARLAGRTPEHVARVLKQATGRTPSEVLNAARMDFASGQLAATARPIIDIAYDCGFNSLSHFYRVFRKQFDVSPRRYRLDNQKVLPRREP
jgi:AraC family cel operon transcriptional repressor